MSELQKKNLTVKTELKVVRTSIDPLALVVADVRLLGHLLVLRDGDGAPRLDRTAHPDLTW